jgi:hypothetical protein
LAITSPNTTAISMTVFIYNDIIIFLKFFTLEN